MDAAQLEKIQQTITNAQKVTIITMQPPFPDALFSLMALRDALNRRDKKVSLIAPGLDVQKAPGQLPHLEEVVNEVPAQQMVIRVGLSGNHVSKVNYEEKDGSVFVHIVAQEGIITGDDIEKITSVIDSDVLIALGIHAPSDVVGWPDGWNQTFTSGSGERTIINLDVDSHNAQFGNINIVDPSASSLSELTFRLFSGLSWEIDADTAQYLYRGITNATRQFRQFMSPETFEVAAQLLRLGAKTKPENEAENNVVNSASNDTPKSDGVEKLESEHEHIPHQEVKKPLAQPIHL
ncbi:hypothetical protein CO180_03700 [candidate division WWE3 bacterium CG_4_9_14_3_um_filter_41_6]|uniref:Uncharacterized protein n=1 Tax=candidate division WWE3 bacterium CG_4_10_14_0_2_um_filter_41_14 TaxID=1975072 RepID=A0A2M7TLQ8_UNCKA|nr:MAG: hypothetical protein COY32_00685 [candidate division WWE3 bacterium CG_4_10_14_0_2_um_filter_41_14]PJA38353.1 MAG: hypothetical protein CO180_03700 [candidate division WWE3 bacterium CG_4_9_14_3_um_filter_41_6]